MLADQCPSDARPLWGLWAVSGAHGGDGAVTESQAGVCAGSGLGRVTGAEGARRWLVVATSQ